MERLGKVLGLGPCLQVCVSTSFDGIWHDRSASAPSMQHFQRFKRHFDKPELASWICFLFFFRVDTRDLLLVSLDTTCPSGHEQIYKVQPCKATRALSGCAVIFYIYQLSKESASLAISWWGFFLQCIPIYTDVYKDKIKKGLSVICLYILVWRLVSLW